MAKNTRDRYEYRQEEDGITSQQNPDVLRHDFAQFDLPLVEYARLHGLTADYMSTDPFQSDLIPRPSADSEDELEDSGSLTTIGSLACLGALNGHTIHEKLDIDKDAAELLASVIKLGQDDGFLDELHIECLVCFKDLKLAEPILSSDLNLDLLRLKRRNTASICADGMILFPLEEIQDPGFVSPEKDAAMRKALSEVGDERLDIDKPTIDYLGDVYKRYQDNDVDMDIAALPSTRKTRFPSPETPPLLTSSPFLQAAAGALEVPEIELTSSPEDLIQKEAMQVERKILQESSTPPPGQNIANQHDYEAVSMYDMPHDDIGRLSSPPQRKRLKDVKVEVPLTPEDSSVERPAKKIKTVSFSETLQTLIPPLDSDMAVSNADLNDVDLENFIENVVEPFAESALKQIEDEQLDELDTTLRVLVPRINDTPVNVPWEAPPPNQMHEAQTNSRKQKGMQLENDFDESEKKWSGVQRIERQLPWTPFPAKLGRVDATEEFDDGDLTAYLAELDIGDDLDVESLLCTNTVPKLLQDGHEDFLIESGDPIDSDDEEVMENVSQQEAALSTVEPSFATSTVATAPTSAIDGRLDMQALLKKRKLELEAAQNKPAAAPVATADSALKIHVSTTSNNIVLAKPTRFSDLSMAGGGLASFLTLHGGSQSIQSQPQQAILQIQHVPPAPVMTRMDGIHTTVAVEHRLEIPCPEVTSITLTFSMIVSPMILADRDLMRELRTYFPAVEIVTRDLLPTKSKDAVQAVNSEADITVSPSFGIISTTLQKVKQMPLPGQIGFFGIRDRIALVSSRYNRLLVLISEGRRQENTESAVTGPLDSRDASTISDLVGFAASLQSNVEVQFIAGGEPQLMTWLVACISRTAILDNSVNLMQDESIWERLLREAGLNAFAAQYVLSKLKMKAHASGFESPSISETSINGMFGVAALAEMTVSQRIEMFREAVGENVIARMSTALDGTFIPNMRNLRAQCGQ